MSASPMAKKATCNQIIPTRKVLINDPSELPSFYSSTPGGTLYSTTPGGTKIVYEKSYLLNLRNSPISKTPPSFEIPSNLMRGASSPPKKCNIDNIKNIKMNKNKPPTPTRNDDDQQFDMDL